MACLTHDHDCGEAACAGASLHRFIDHSGVRCLNAAEPSLAYAVLRPWEQRHEREPALESNDDDCELLLYVPFTCDVRLTGIVVAGGADGTSPSRLRVFINRDDLDFGAAAELPPVQEWQLAEDRTASLEYTTRAVKFVAVGSLWLHFPTNGGADTTRLHFVGLRGSGDERVSREVLKTIVYESSARPVDHRVPGGETQTQCRLGH